MRVTTFPDVSGSVAHGYDVPWSQIVASCQSPAQYTAKPLMPLIKLAAFGDQRSARGSLRHDANLQAVTGVEGDYDAGVIQPADAAALLAMHGLEAIIYTSPSHTPAAPRWRVLAPLSRDHAPDARRELTARLNGALGGILAPESFTASQTYYIGAVTGVPYECHHIAGIALDLAVNVPPAYPATPTFTGTVIARTDADLDELRSALAVLDADDYHEWVAVGQALACLGDQGRALWVEWSSKSAKHDDADDARWDTFTGDKTGFPAIFAKAQRAGWENPKARKPLDLSGVGFGTSARIGAKPVAGGRLVLGEDMAKLFEGCCYVQSLNQVLVPGGDLLDRQRFDVVFGGYSYMLDHANTVKAKSAWDAFTKSQVWDFPKAHDICFRPERTPGEVFKEDGRVLANIWWPVETKREPGDVDLFLDHLHRLLPDERDRAILLAYLAALVQYPGVKFQWCPVIQGAEGNGKSFISSCIEKAIGDKYTHKPNATDIANKFTGWLVGKLFISVEEIKTDHKRETLDALKPLITNPRVEIQGKGANQVTGDNRANFLMFSNHKDAIPTGIDKRRYCVFYCAQQSPGTDWLARDGMVGNYFPRLYSWAKAGGYAHVAHYLATYEIPVELNPAGVCQRAPATTSTAEAASLSLGALEQEIREAIDSGDTPGLRGGWASSKALHKALAAAGLRRPSHHRLREAMHALGYVLHPALHDGRVNSPIMIPDDNSKPRLYVRQGHIALNETHPAQVAKLYVAAQGVAFGQGAAGGASGVHAS